MNSLAIENRAPPPVFRLGGELDVAALSSHYRRSNRLRVPDILDPVSALTLYKHLAREVDWMTFLVAGGAMYGASASASNTSWQDERRQIKETQGTGFTCLFDANRLFPDAASEGSWEENPPHTRLLLELRDFLNSQEFLELCRSVTGVTDIVRAELQATRYRQGQFMGLHSTFPYFPEKDGCAAGFEINLTIEWRPEWGGLHEFLLSQDFKADALVPSFNLMDIYSPKQGHWISPVSPWAEGERLSVSGWLFSGSVETVYERR